MRAGAKAFRKSWNLSTCLITVVLLPNLACVKDGPMRMVQVPSLLHPFQFSDLVVTVLGSCNQLELFAQGCSMICWPKGAGQCTKVKQHEHLMQNEVQVLQGFSTCASWVCVCCSFHAMPDSKPKPEQVELLKAGSKLNEKNGSPAITLVGQEFYEVKLTTDFINERLQILERNRKNKKAHFWI